MIRNSLFIGDLESFLYVIIVAVALVVKLVETVAVFKMQACEM
jgi:hypothetical protein